jgi:hypothetical protein
VSRRSSSLAVDSRPTNGAVGTVFTEHASGWRLIHKSKAHTCSDPLTLVRWLVKCTANQWFSRPFSSSRLLCRPRRLTLRMDPDPSRRPVTPLPCCCCACCDCCCDLQLLLTACAWLDSDMGPKVAAPANSGLSAMPAVTTAASNIAASPGKVVMQSCSSRCSMHACVSTNRSWAADTSSCSAVSCFSRLPKYFCCSTLKSPKAVFACKGGKGGGESSVACF